MDLEAPGNEFDSNQCVNKLLQGCQYTAGKCPCRLKKTTPEKQYEDTENYVRAHWRSVVLCKDCIHRPRQDSSFRIIPPIKNGKFDETCPFIRKNWKETVMPKDADYCSLGEKDEKERT